MTDKTTRRDLMKPVQLLGLAALCAVFAGIVTLVAMGFFQRVSDDQPQRALMVAAIVGGVTFIVALVMLALLLLAVDPAQVGKTLDRPVLVRDDTARPGDTGPDAAPGAEDGAGRPRS